FFSLGLLYYFFEIAFSGSKRIKLYFLFGLFALLAALNQHMNALFAVTIYLSGLFFLSKENNKKYLLTGLFIVIAYLPHLPITLWQLGMAGIGPEQGGWLDKPYQD